VMRLDRPPADQDLNAFAQTAVGYICKLREATGVMPVAFGDTSADDLAPLLGALIAAADRVGLEVVDSAAVGTDGYLSGTTNELRPLAEIEPEPEYSEALTPQERAALPARDESLWRELNEIDPLFGELYMGELVLRAQAFVVAEPHCPQDFAIIGQAMDVPALRDIVLITWAQGPDRGMDAAEAQIAWELGSEYPTDLARTLWGEGPQPDPKRLHAARENLRLLAASRDNPGAGIFSVLAWISWALGESSVANEYVRMAYEIEPGHGLSEIVAAMVYAGHLPEWAFSKAVRP